MTTPRPSPQYTCRWSVFGGLVRTCLSMVWLCALTFGGTVAVAHSGDGPESSVKGEREAPLSWSEGVVWQPTLEATVRPTRDHSGSDPAESVGEAESTSMGRGFGQTGVGLLWRTLLVLGAVCLLAYVVLKWGVSRIFGVSPEGGGLVELVERKKLGPERAVVVVRVGERRLVLGESEAGIEMLTELVAVEASVEPRKGQEDGITEREGEET